MTTKLLRKAAIAVILVVMVIIQYIVAATWRGSGVVGEDGQGYGRLGENCSAVKA